MCYNSNCKIEIKSCIDGTCNIISVKGAVMKMPAGVSFFYTLDGDECTLTVNDCVITQERRGGQNIRMVFRKGQQTECLLESGGFSGKFTVFTHDVHFIEGNKITLSINYTIGEEKVELGFSAEYI